MFSTGLVWNILKESVIYYFPKPIIALILSFLLWRLRGTKELKLQTKLEVTSAIHIANNIEKKT